MGIRDRDLVGSLQQEQVCDAHGVRRILPLTLLQEHFVLCSGVQLQMCCETLKAGLEGASNVSL
jgi:hypothetical protein